MGETTSIEWTDSSWNPIRARNLKTGKIGWHCEHATAGCALCYAEGFNKRLGTGLPFKPGHRADIEIFLDEKMLLAPLRWKRPRRIFVGSMTDLFADFVTDAMLDQIFAVMVLCPQHTFQVLTKRAARMRDYFAARMTGDPWAEAADYIADLRGIEDHPIVLEPSDLPLPNVWLGVSCERQEEADERIPLLLQTPAAVRFISAEPLLGAIDLTRIDRGDAQLNSLNGNVWYQGAGSISSKTLHGKKLDWVIVGGESGGHARPMLPDWARSIRDQCAHHGVSFFMKQWGEFRPDDDAPGAHTAMRRVGKKAAGRLLDGRTHDEMPA